MPASGPKLLPAIEQARHQLEELARRRCFDPKAWGPHPSLWRELLNQSRRNLVGNVAPNLLKGEVAAPIGIKLTGRQWDGFQKWFSRWVLADLCSLAVETKIPALCAIRFSERKGGHPDQSEAIYYLAYFECKLDSYGCVYGASAAAISHGQPIGASPSSDDSKASGESHIQGVMKQGGSPSVSAEMEGQSCNSDLALRRWRIGLSMLRFGVSLIGFVVFFHQIPDVLFLSDSLF